MDKRSSRILALACCACFPSLLRRGDLGLSRFVFSRSTLLVLNDSIAKVDDFWERFLCSLIIGVAFLFDKILELSFVASGIENGLDLP